MNERDIMQKLIVDKPQYHVCKVKPRELGLTSDHHHRTKLLLLIAECVIRDGDYEPNHLYNRFFD